MIRQLRDTREQLMLSVGAHFDPTADRILNLNLVLLDKPHLRKYIYGSNGVPARLPEPGTSERGEALALAECFVDLLDTEMLRRRAFPHVDDLLPDFEPWLRDLLLRSEAVCLIITENPEWYSAQLLARFAHAADAGRVAHAPVSIPREWRVEPPDASWLSAAESHSRQPPAPPTP